MNRVRRSGVSGGEKHCRGKIAELGREIHHSERDTADVRNVVVVKWLNQGAKY